MDPEGWSSKRQTVKATACNREKHDVADGDHRWFSEADNKFQTMYSSFFAARIQRPTFLRQKRLDAAVRGWGSDPDAPCCTDRSPMAATESDRVGARCSMARCSLWLAFISLSSTSRRYKSSLLHILCLWLYEHKVAGWIFNSKRLSALYWVNEPFHAPTKRSSLWTQMSICTTSNQQVGKCNPVLTRTWQSDGL